MERWRVVVWDLQGVVRYGQQWDQQHELSFAAQNGVIDVHSARGLQLRACIINSSQPDALDTSRRRRPATITITLPPSECYASLQQAAPGTRTAITIYSRDAVQCR